MNEQTPMKLNTSAFGRHVFLLVLLNIYV